LKTDESIWRKLDDESSWVRIPGGLSRISAGPDGAWGVNNADNIYYWNKNSN